MTQEKLHKLLHRLFTSSITKSQYDELKSAIGDVPDGALMDGLENAWQKTNFDGSMPGNAKERIKSEIDRVILRGRVVAFVRKSVKVAAAIALPLLLASTIYLAVDRHNIKQQADLLDVYVSKGEKATVNLPDGSTVTLNSESKLIYPSNFSSNERWIRLEGEAYFHVSKSHGRSFTVKTRKLDVKVLGTTFNVSAYNDDPTTSVVLVEGSVSAGVPGMNPTLITPNQKLVVDKSTGNVAVKNVDAYSYTCWRDGIINFESEPIVDVLDKLSRQMGVQLEFDPKQFKGDKISGKLDLNEGVDAVLKTISLASPIKYVKHKTKVIITPLR